MTDVEVWQRHFVNMSKGKTKPDKYGHYFVDSVQRGGNNPPEPSIQFVTPTAQAVELAKSELKHQEDGRNLNKRRAPSANKKTHNKKIRTSPKKVTKKKRSPSANKKTHNKKIRTSPKKVNKKKRSPSANKKRVITPRKAPKYTDIWRE